MKSWAPSRIRARRRAGLRAGTPVIGGAADHIASALGAGVVSAGDVLLKFGGSVDILTATDHARPDPRLFLDYHLKPGLFVPNGCMATGGSALNWFVRQFASGEKQAADEAGLSIHQWLDRLAEARPAGSDGLVITPYFLGEKTPIHDANARATFDGLTLSHDIGHLWRALLEAYAYALAHHVEVMNEIGYKTERFIVSDGGSTSRVWMQIVADVLERPVQRLAGHPGSCVGAAWTAAIGVGLASDWSGISAFVRPADRIEPRPETADRLPPRLSPLSRPLSPPGRPVRARCIMSLFRAVAWDIDGTLIDSEPLHQRALVAASAALGADLSDIEPEAFRGVHAIDIWKALKPRFPRGSSFKTWIAAIEGYYVAHAGELEPNPGALEAMRELAERGVAQACVSNSGRTIVDANIKALGIGKIIAFSLSLEDVSSGKPDPEPYREAARRFALPSRTRSSRSRTAARAPVQRARRGFTWSAIRPSGEPFVGSDRSIVKLMEVVALFEA